MVMSIPLQDALVTLVALLSAVVVLRRMIGAFRPGRKTPACQNCASGAAACASAVKTNERSSDKPVPLVLHRR
jgi:hypothetical protein